MSSSKDDHIIHSNAPKNPLRDNGVSPSVTFSSSTKNEKKTPSDSATGKMLKKSK